MYMCANDTWENVLGVGTVRMDPSVPLLYDALEHDARFRGFLTQRAREVVGVFRSVAKRSFLIAPNIAIKSARRS